MNNVFKISAVHRENVYLVSSPMGDNFSWYYIMLDSLKKPIFEAKIGKESIDLKEYGKILFSGWGKEPPAEIKEKITQQYS